VTDKYNTKYNTLIVNSHISMPGGQFSHFRDKMSLVRDTGHLYWQAYITSRSVSATFFSYACVKVRLMDFDALDACRNQSD